ncbi:MAG: tRNA (adenosine(37)-N6)-dimethylallyltransferase MiaA [Alphaproteobacteria bacterium]
MTTKPKVIVIYGATASGKSSLALKIAEEYGGTIINADSMQVYNDLQIITARPDTSKTSIPHKLYGFLNGLESCSAGIWAKMAAKEIKNCTLPIIAGGTGLYIEALTNGLSPIPEVDDSIKAKFRDDLIETAELYKLLQEEDADAAAKLKANDRQRITRALEVFESTGKSILSWQKEAPKCPVEADFIKIFVNPERQQLYQKCNNRFDEMIDQGALKEVKELIAKNYPKNCQIMKALGVEELALYLEGKINLEEAKDKAKVKTRQYAKRQITWFKNRFISDVTAVTNDNYFEISQLFTSLKLRKCI